MYLQHRFLPVMLAALTALATTANAQTPPPGMITGFEESGPTEVTPVAGGYATGPLLANDNWTGGATFPRVLTKTDIEAELTAAGLTSAGAVHSGNQAVLVSKVNTASETTGYFVRNTFPGLETEQLVTVDFWARPLTSGIGEWPTTEPHTTNPGNNRTIGTQQGNMFIGIMDSSATANGDPANEIRAAAVRFGIDSQAGNSNPYTNVLERHIDFGSASAGSAVWVKSGQLWTADTWYNFKFELDYTAKTYNFFIDGLKINPEPIRFYDERSKAATRFFISRGTNQAGSIVDDVSITASETPMFEAGDFNLDGDVDGHDFLQWQRDTSLSYDDWEANFGFGPGASAIPEPTSAMLAAGVLLLGAGRLRRGARA